ncbi:MAG: RNA 2',3'-cyclic phosphodiesterase [Elusimicrobia bacterium]|nr:RNA 2',3'-cyclic phosphodiesterase [Elusimicrobiota bacterium]MDE2236327.1 RNA 2',3'-cyclic phosphodiesterase [Elusimicrobiota bacterium]MDE2425400.1 RNA 2',3'-cyclic phosphodiesterase [Elusimicrobiota bacterium]
MNSASANLRLFIAVPVVGGALDGARLCLEALRGCGADARWSADGAMHLTLRFLGKTPPARLPALARALARAAAGHAAFKMEFDHLGWFGPAARPQVVWAGLGDGLESLKALAQSLDVALEAEGIARDPRPFRPHLTLGRLRSARAAGALIEKLKGYPIRWPCRADRLVLYASRLTREGAVHEALSESALEA